MKKLHFLGFQIVLLCLYSTTESSASDNKNRKGRVDNKNEANELIRAPPSYSNQYSIQIIGPSNVVEINGRCIETIPDSLDCRNKIRVNGQGNTLSIQQINQESNVNIVQQGRNNKLTISQK